MTEHRDVAKGVLVATRARGFETTNTRREYIRQNGIQPFYVGETPEDARQRFAAQYHCQPEDIKIIEWNM